jgi:NAD(P)H dehydrogenase (quinone)
MTSAIAVLGAAGATGRELVGVLTERGHAVRAILHRPEQAALFPLPVECRVAELEDVASLVEAFRGAGIVHYIPPVFNRREEQFASNVIDAAEQTDVPRVVYHSVLHAATPEMPHHWRKSRVEWLLRHSSIEWTVLQPAMYCETALAFFDADRGVLHTGFDVSKTFTPVSLKDLAAAAANVLTHEGHAFATYELAGPERLTFETMGVRLGDLLNRRISTNGAEPDVVVSRVSTKRGFKAEAAEEFRLMLRHYNDFGLTGNSNVLRWLLAREPTSFAMAIRQTLGGKTP